MAQVRPLNHFGNRQNPMPERYLNQQPKGYENHSRASHKRSEHYHAHIMGGRPSSARVTDQLNPDRSVSLANRQGRSFPGL